jgi:hypothetical protein
MQQIITVLKVIEEPNHIADEEKDSVSAFWEVKLSYLKGITKTPKEGILVVRVASPRHILTGKYKVIDFFNKRPVYEPAV